MLCLSLPVKRKSSLHASRATWSLCVCVSVSVGALSSDCVAVCVPSTSQIRIPNTSQTHPKHIPNTSQAHPEHIPNTARRIPNTSQTHPHTSQIQSKYNPNMRKVVTEVQTCEACSYTDVLLGLVRFGSVLAIFGSVLLRPGNLRELMKTYENLRKVNWRSYGKITIHKMAYLYFNFALL